MNQTEQFNNNIPIYIQIADIIRIKIISGDLKKGEKIPSVRELGLILKVNPNTVQKALQLLEEEKLLYTERTNGKYVTSDLKLIKRNKDILAQENIKSYLENMRKIGISTQEAIKYLQEMEDNNVSRM